jgi:hypothetical protein
VGQQATKKALPFGGAFLIALVCFGKPPIQKPKGGGTPFYKNTSHNSAFYCGNHAFRPVLRLIK